MKNIDGISIKRCTSDDLEQVINLCNCAFEENTNLKEAKAIFLATQDDPNQIYLNGVADGRVVAHVKITVVPTFYQEMGTYSIINHFCVMPEYRRRGIATAMLEEIVKISRSMKCKSMKLWSKNFRVAAHALYKHFGFDLIEAGFFEKSI